MPSEPAKCATAVSTVTTRSNPEMTAAVSAKSVNSAARFTMPPGVSAAEGPNLQAPTLNPGEARERQKAVRGKRAGSVVGVFRIARPNHADASRSRPQT